MNIQELKSKSSENLISQAEELGIDIEKIKTNNMVVIKGANTLN